MRDLKKLPEISELILHDLHAGEELKEKIVLEAVKTEEKGYSTKYKLRWMVPAVACLSVLLAVLISVRPFGPLKGSVIIDFPAGALDSEKKDDSNELIRKNADRDGVIADHSETVDLICINDRCYVCLDTDVKNINDDLIDDMIGEIDEYSESPELSDFTGISSNTLNIGNRVFAIEDMGDTFASVDTGDGYKIYQRISYGCRNASSDLFDSGLLSVCGHIKAIAVDGKYKEISAEKEKLLSDLLLSETEFISPEYTDLGNKLDIYLDNGLIYRLSFSDFRISGCGTWANPELLDEIGRIMQ